MKFIVSSEGSFICDDSVIRMEFVSSMVRGFYFGWGLIVWFVFVCGDVFSLGCWLVCIVVGFNC